MHPLRLIQSITKTGWTRRLLSLGIVRYIIKPRSTNPRDAFRERAIRLLVLIGVTIFTIAGLLNLEESVQPDALVWYGIIFVLCALIIFALNHISVRAASIILIPATALIVLDPTAAYWSAGTVVLSLVFTFIFQIIMVTRRDMLLAVLINLGVYTALVAFSPDPPPLESADYYASPLTAMLTTYAAHGILIGVMLFIRHEQQLLDRMKINLLQLEQERLEFALKKEQELSELKSRMMIRIGHEFRTPLASIQLSAEALERYLDRLTMEQRRQKTSLIHKQIRHITQMLDAITDVVNNQLTPSDLTLSSISLANLVEAVADDIKTTYEFPHTFEIELAAVPVLHADYQLLRSTLTSLLYNAAQFSSPESTVRVEVSVADGYALVRITDTGIGISEDELSLIFEPFYRGTNIGEVSGLGLGMTKAQAVIVAHSGEIWVDSTLGQGTSVTLRLPLVM